MNSKSNSGDLMSKKTDGNDGDSSAVPIKQTGRTGDSSPKLSPASSATTVLPPPYQSSRAAKPVTLPPNLSSEVLAVDTVDDHGRSVSFFITKFSLFFFSFCKKFYSCFSLSYHSMNTMNPE